MVNSSSNLKKPESSFSSNCFMFRSGFFLVSAQMVKWVWAFFRVKGISLILQHSKRASGFPSVIKAIWFRKSRRELLTGVADNMSTFVLTPERMIFSINHCARFICADPSSRIFSMGLPRKLWDSSMTMRSYAPQLKLPRSMPLASERPLTLVRSVWKRTV